MTAQPGPFFWFAAEVARFEEACAAARESEVWRQVEAGAAAHEARVAGHGTDARCTNCGIGPAGSDGLCGRCWLQAAVVVNADGSPVLIEPVWSSSPGTIRDYLGDPP